MWRYAAGIFFVAAGALGVVYVLIYGITQLQTDTAERRGEAGESEQVIADGDRRVALREEFYDLCSTIESQNQQLVNQQALIDATTDEEEQQRLRAGLTGIQNTRASNIQEYNSKAANDETRGFLRNTELPERIDAEDEEIECGSPE